MDTQKVILDKCPHCGSTVTLVVRDLKAYIICDNRNCLCCMSVSWGTEDDSEVLIAKLCADWNKRSKDQTALVRAIEYVEHCRENLKQEVEGPYSEYCTHCLEVLDTMLDKLRLFTR